MRDETPTGCAPRRRVLKCAAGAVLAMLLVPVAGCGSSAPLRWHRLGLDVPAGPSRSGQPLPASPGEPVWELASRLGLPAYLERDELQFDSGQGRVDMLPLDRWAEPLAEAVPRLLLHDLTLLRGAGMVWPAPAPAGLGDRLRLRLRVQILALQAEPAQGRLRLQARWTFSSDTSTRAGQASIESPLEGASPSALVQAHREALWQLAQRIAAVGAGGAVAGSGGA